jgi:hypothetical protein
MNSDLYKKTSTILNKIIDKKISIKSAIYNDTNIVDDRNFRKIYKLVNEIMKNRTLLDEVKFNCTHIRLLTISSLRLTLKTMNSSKSFYMKLSFQLKRRK